MVEQQQEAPGTGVGVPLSAPFPWFGGKRRIAAMVWKHFGDVGTYLEPFAGSLAVLLGRPTTPRLEIVNDIDAFVANFWRAVQHEPEAVARWADAPVNEVDLHARHQWLHATAAARVQRLMADPHAYDAQVAGWWVWGLSAWVGNGWCDPAELRRDGLPKRQRPHITNFGTGVHARRRADLVACMHALARRLRQVRVLCGDWQRVLTPAVWAGPGATGVLLDPPYAHAHRDTLLYRHDAPDMAAAVRAWAIAHGELPTLRIALCAYDDLPAPPGWTRVRWRANGGYGNQGAGRGRANAAREVVDFSPACLAPQQPTLPLVDPPLAGTAADTPGAAGARPRPRPRRH